MSFDETVGAGRKELFTPRQLASMSLPPAGSAAEARLKAAATLELARARYHLKRTRSGRHVLALPITTKVKGTSMQHTDTPAELVEQSDGVTDDGAFDESIIGACACDEVGSGLRQHLSIHSGVAGNLQHLTVSGLGDLTVAGELQHLTVSGLGDLAVAGIPSYLFTRAHLHDATVRARIAQSIRNMTPKLRRRVLHRLQQAVKAARIMAPRIGVVVNAYPTISGSNGWTGITVSGRRSSCPYANVAGALTP